MTAETFPGFEMVEMGSQLVAIEYPSLSAILFAALDSIAVPQGYCADLHI